MDSNFASRIQFSESTIREAYFCLTRLFIASWAAVSRSPVPGFIELPFNTISASRTPGLP